MSMPWECFTRQINGMILEANMRVFYPVSTRFSEFTNEDMNASSGWSILLSTFCFVLWVLMLSTMSSFEAGVENGNIAQPQTVSKSRDGTINKTGSIAQEYIDAHRHAQNYIYAKPVKYSLHQDEPIKLKANGGLFL
jgi:hypothetical protein